MNSNKSIFNPVEDDSMSNKISKNTIVDFNKSQRIDEMIDKLRVKKRDKEEAKEIHYQQDFKSYFERHFKSRLKVKRFNKKSTQKPMKNSYFSPKLSNLSNFIPLRRHAKVHNSLDFSLCQIESKENSLISRDLRSKMHSSIGSINRSTSKTSKSKIDAKPQSSLYKSMCSNMMRELDQKSSFVNRLMMRKMYDQNMIRSF